MLVRDKNDFELIFDVFDILSSRTIDIDVTQIVKKDISCCETGNSSILIEDLSNVRSEFSNIPTSSSCINVRKCQENKCK